MFKNFEEFSKVVSESIIAEYGENSFSEVMYKKIIDFAADTEIRSTIMESLDVQDLIENTTEYNLMDTPLVHLEFNRELLEAALDFLYGDEGKVKKEYRKDKNGKIITGMNKQSNRYTGSKKERDQKKAAAYYARGNNAEKQRQRMKRYMRIKRAQEVMAKDNEVADREGITPIQAKAKRKAATAASRRAKRAVNQDAINARSDHTRSLNADKNKAAAEERRRKRSLERNKK